MLHKLLLLNSLLISAEALIAEEPEFKHTYQNVLVDGKSVNEGYRTCRDRYESIRPIFEAYKRPFTVLDLGASEGYFSFSIARDYPSSVCVMVEDSYFGTDEGTGRRLLKICHHNNLPNTILLKRIITLKELQTLSKCEHFDVVIAFNFIGHFGSEWKEAYDAVKAMGDHILIEQGNGSEAWSLMSNTKEAEVLGTFTRHSSPTAFGQIFHFDMARDTIPQNHFLSYSKNPNADIPDNRKKVYSDYLEKKLYKPLPNNDEFEISNWIPGINLITYKCLNGVYPSHEKLLQSLNQLDYEFHNDFNLKNIIIQGSQLKLIDWTHIDSFKNKDNEMQLEILKKAINLTEENFENYIHTSKL